MSAHTAPALSDAPVGWRVMWRSRDQFAFAIVGIVIAQALWLGWLAHRGWYYQDDLSFLSDASGRRFGWAYLSLPVNDHFAPGLRAAFWMLRRTTGLHYDVTILVRMSLQGGATVLLYRLLLLLVGRRPGVIYAIVWFAFSPFIMPGFLWLSSATNLLTAQILIVAGIDAYIRYSLTGRLRQAGAAAACVVSAVLFWEKSVVTLLLLVLLSFGFLHAGDLRQRLLAMLRRWPVWLMIGAPLSGWLVIFFGGNYGGSAHRVSAANMGDVLRTGWVDALAPTLLGGPWTWVSSNSVYFGLSAPRTVTTVVAQVAVVVLLFVSIRRTGLRALLAWALPASNFALGLLLVAVGRFWFFGDLIARQYTYLYDFAVPMAIGATLALIPTTPGEVAQRALGQVPSASDEGRGVAAHTAAVSARGLLPIVALCLFVSSSVSSGVNFASRWAQNPTEEYVHTLTASVRAAGPLATVYDTSIPSRILPLIRDGHHVSDIMKIAGIRARFDVVDTAPMVANDSGRLTTAGILPAAHGVQNGSIRCAAIVRGDSTARIALQPAPTANEYFLTLSYLQQNPSVVYFAVEDTSGHTTSPVRGRRAELPSQLGTVTLRLPLAAPRSVEVRSESPSTNVCLSQVTLGVPVPVPVTR